MVSKIGEVGEEVSSSEIKKDGRRNKMINGVMTITLGDFILILNRQMHTNYEEPIMRE